MFETFTHESLASATVMLGDFAGTLEGPGRNTLLGIAQVVVLGGGESGAG